MLDNQDAAHEEEPPSCTGRISEQGHATGAEGRARGGQSCSRITRLSTISHRLTTIAASAESRGFIRRYYPDVNEAQWNDWRWQIANRICTAEALSRFFPLTDDERDALGQGEFSLPFAVTPYYLAVIAADPKQSRLRACVIPGSAERRLSPGETADPLDEERDSPTEGLVHRYPDRALFLATDFCSTYCRYCTRSRLVGRAGADARSRKDRWEAAIACIEARPAIRDVIISGGDPLTLTDQALEWLLRRLRGIKHVEMLRIGSKVPAVLPQRVTSNLTRMLKRYHPLYLSLHFTHPDELTEETGQACNRLADAGIPLGSQTVFLQSVNDDTDTLTRLYRGLLAVRVRPYYLYQCDPIPGSAHFRAPVARALEVMRGLRGHTSGYAVPTFVIDAPGGGGKIPLLPDAVVGRDAEGLLLTNYQGRTFRYPELAAGAEAPCPAFGVTEAEIAGRVGFPDTEARPAHLDAAYGAGFLAQGSCL